MTGAGGTGGPGGGGPERGGGLRIGPGTVVALAFSMRSEEGELLEEWTEDDPIRWVHGSGTLVPGIEKALAGRAAGDRLSVRVPPDEAFGPRREGGTRRILRSALPHRGVLHRGMPFVMEDEDGKLAPLWIAAVDGDAIEVDRNHPLAGRTLLFEVTVVSVRPSTETEERHGEASEGGRPRGGRGAPKR